MFICSKIFFALLFFERGRRPQEGSVPREKATDSVLTGAKTNKENDEIMSYTRDASNEKSCSFMLIYVTFRVGSWVDDFSISHIAMFFLEVKFMQVVS